VSLQTGADLAQGFELLNREKALLRQYSIQRRCGVSFGKYQTVAFLPSRILRVGFHLLKIQVGQNVRYRERTARVTGFRAVSSLNDAHADLARCDCQLFFGVAVHVVGSFLSVAFIAFVQQRIPRLYKILSTFKLLSWQQRSHPLL